MSGCDCDFVESAQETVLTPPGLTSPSGWCDCVVLTIRAHIGDLNPSGLQFSDARLLQVFNAAAFFVNTDIAGCTNITRPTITVCDGGCTMGTNPFEHPSFLNLAVLKAACMVDQGSARAQARRQGLSAACGPAKLSISSGSSAYESLFKWGPCAAYKDLKEDLCFRRPMQAATHCAQIMGAFTSWNIYGGACCSSRPNSRSCGY